MNILEEIPKSNSSPSQTFSSGTTSMNSVNAPTSSYDSTLSERISMFDGRNIMIGILVFIIILTYFGINVLDILGKTVQKGVDILAPFVTQLLDMIGYSSGNVLNKAAEVTSDVTKESVEIAEGAVKNIGNILIGDEAVGHRKYANVLNEPSPDVPEDNIQKSLSSGKTKWCLVGEYQNKRGCIDISESDKCLSGQVFPNEKMCLNPTMKN